MLPLVALLFFLTAITIFGKGPTYLSTMGIYWGELTMMILMVWIGRQLYHRSPPAGMTSLLGKLAAAYMLLGATLMMKSLGRWPLFDVIRDSAIWYYAAFFFVGIYVAASASQAGRMWKALSWIWVAAIAWNLFVRLGGKEILPEWLDPRLAGRDMTLLSGSSSENYMHVGLAAILLLLGLPDLNMHRLGKLWLALPICVAAGLIFTSPSRGVKIALICAALTGAMATFRYRKVIWPVSRMFVPVFVLVTLLTGTLIISEPANLATAGRLSRFEELAESDSRGTAYWRLVWWKGVIDEVHASNLAVGLGFGRNLAELNPFLQGNDKKAWPVRSPHNFNMTVFGRMGYLGLALWIAILGVGLGRLFLRVRRGGFDGRCYTVERHKELTFWLMMLVATWVNSSLGVLMEGPVLGIWFWFALGFATGRSTGEDGMAALKERAGMTTSGAQHMKRSQDTLTGEQVELPEPKAESPKPIL